MATVMYSKIVHTFIDSYQSTKLIHFITRFDQNHIRLFFFKNDLSIVFLNVRSSGAFCFIVTYSNGAQAIFSLTYYLRILAFKKSRPF